MVADNVGLILRGIYDENDVFQLDYCYPTFFGESVSTNNDVDVIKQSERKTILLCAMRLDLELI